MKKAICIITALIFALSCASAIGEGAFGELYDAAVQLALDTHNVTLSAEASFSYDGELFKVMHAKYMQDGERSFLSYMLDTPDLLGEMTTSGYIVHGLGNVAYAGDKLYGYYYENPTKVSDTILPADNRLSLQLKLGRLLALSAEELTEQSRDGNVYSFKATRLNELINNGVYYILLEYIQNKYYLDVFGLYNYNVTGATLYNEDWTELVKKQYAAIYQSEMPTMDEIYADDTLYGRYSVALNAANQIEAEATAKYESGIVYLKADGSSEWYESEEEFMLKTERLDLYYASWSDAFKNYYKVVTGEEIDDERIDYIVYSPNQELWNAYNAFTEDMQAYYTKLVREQDPKALSAVLMPDMSIKTYDYIIRNETTVKQHIIESMSFAKMKNLDAQVTVDDDGRLIGLSGALVVEVTDKKDNAHELKVEFDCKAEDYGTTKVAETFNPSEYDLVSFDEYERKMMLPGDEDDPEGDAQDDYWDNLIANDPKTVSFLGETYETMLDEYYAD